MVPVAVLAAGKSTRMGRPKATLPLDDADTFLTRIIRARFRKPRWTMWSWCWVMRRRPF